MIATRNSLLNTLFFFALALGLTLASASLITNNDYSERITFSKTLDWTVFAQSVPLDIADNNAAQNIENESEEIIYRQGIMSSFGYENETAQVAPILTHRDDGKIYSGVLTYSATSPVEIGFLSQSRIDNATLSQLIDQLGISAPNWLDIATPSVHNLTEVTPQIIGGIQPDYGTSTPYYSASMPFVAGAVGLWSPVGEPFLVSYQLYAKLVEPETVNDIALNDAE